MTAVHRVWEQMKLELLRLQGFREDGLNLKRLEEIYRAWATSVLFIHGISVPCIVGV